MLPSRYMSSSAAPLPATYMRKSRVEGKSSFIPKPRRPGSIDRASLEARRPSGIRSSSAEPPRATIASSRLSREASATKIPLNKRSRSQQGESSRYGQASMTPLRKFSRPTTTPQRTPTDERFDRSWQTALDRALAFVTVKDQRPLTNPAWQRSEYHRVQEALAVRGGGNGMALTRPLTIAQFVDITAELLHSITRDTNLNTDNYVGKLPHTAKRLLYPGAISKSWLKTVNTLHAFPHALALIVYLLDLVTRIEQPVTLEWLYADKGELAQLKRQYVKNCWARFQTGENCDDLRVEYLSELRGLLGNDEQKIAELEDNIKKFQLCLDDESERAARADEARRIDRRAALLAALRSENGGRVATRSATDAAAAANRDAADLLKNLDYEIEQMALEEQQLSKELQEQSMSVEERTHLLEEVDYANRVQESKRTLAEQIAKMVQTKENDLALWQKRTMDSCMEYNQGLIHASARFPDLAPLVDEKELMSTGCAEAVSSAVTSLKQKLASLNEQNAERERSRNKQKRDKSNKVEETRATISEMQSSIQREQESITAEQNAEASELASHAAEESAVTAAMEAVRRRLEEHERVESTRAMWAKQETLWQNKLSSLQETIHSHTELLRRRLQEEEEKRTAVVMGAIGSWQKRLEETRLD